MKKGDKIWIRDYLDLKEAIILKIEADGKLVRYAIAIGTERLNWFYLLTKTYLEEVCTVEEFNNIKI